MKKPEPAPAVREYNLKFKVKKRLTLQLWKWQPDEEKLLRFEGKIEESKQIAPTKDSKKMQPARIAQVTNLESGELCQIICGKVLQSTLEEGYPNAGYVGKQFAITQHAIEGKAYKGYSVSEIEVEGK